LIYANKLSKVGANLYTTMESVKQRLGVRHSPVVLPIGEEGGFKGLVDLVRMKAVMYNNDLGTDITIEEIPADMVEKAKEYRAKLIDQVAEYDDATMEKYLGGEELTEEEIIRAMRAGTLAVKF